MRLFNIAFRVDASLEIGSGHVMRCLALADAFKDWGAICHFICRIHAGHLIGLIGQRGHVVHSLSINKADSLAGMYECSAQPSHAPWLGVSQEVDANESAVILEKLQPAWLIVDHYALDARWEHTQRAHSSRIMVIDDLADRPHDCDLLLDQNLGRTESDYAGLVPTHCRKLIGPAHALLRPEFARLREYSLNRRKSPQLKSMLVTMGGVDQHNATGTILKALRTCALPDDLSITVVMGGQSPWLRAVEELAAEMPWQTEIKVNVVDMAQLMAASDFAIGAAGSTSWERCCLGLPSLMVVLAENQRGIAEALHSAGAAYNLGDPFTQDFSASFQRAIQECLQNIGVLANISSNAARVTDGRGTHQVISNIETCG